MSKKMDKDTNALNWFEISVNDIGRATQFYEAILDLKLLPHELMGMQMAMFPTDGMNGRVGGALVKSPHHHPGNTGALVYLNANPDVQAVLDRVVKAGGKVLMDKTAIDNNAGFMAVITDSEGNAVGLHSTH